MGVNGEGMLSKLKRESRAAQLEWKMKAYFIHLQHFTYLYLQTNGCDLAPKQMDG